MLTFVTVIFEDFYDHELFLLQTKTFYKIDSEIISKIIVIKNTGDNDTFCVYRDNFYKNIIQNYPLELQNKVQLISRNELYNIYNFTNINRSFIENKSGWNIQQLLKLLVSKIIHTKHYIVLDSKDHFINCVNYDTFFLKKKPILMNKFSHIERNPYSRKGLINSMKYFNNTINQINNREHILDASFNIYTTIEPITPFIFNTNIVIDMINYISNKNNANFISIFLLKNFSEFQLYYSYLIFTNKINEYQIISFFEYKFWNNSTIKSFLNDRFLDLINKNTISCIGLYRNIRNVLTDKNDINLLNVFYEKFLNKEQMIHIHNLFIHGDI